MSPHETRMYAFVTRRSQSHPVPDQQIDILGIPFAINCANPKDNGNLFHGAGDHYRRTSLNYHLGTTIQGWITSRFGARDNWCTALANLYDQSNLSDHLSANLRALFQRSGFGTNSPKPGANNVFPAIRDHIIILLLPFLEQLSENRNDLLSGEDITRRQSEFIIDHREILEIV